MEMLQNIKKFERHLDLSITNSPTSKNCSKIEYKNQ